MTYLHLFSRCILFTILLGLLSSEAFSEDVKVPAKENFHLYLLVGQSNMAGRGKVEEQDLVANPKLLMLTKELKWEVAKDPLHFDKPIAGTGLGKTFGLEMLKDNPDVTVGLIPCAAGGSPIKSWEVGGYHGQTKSHPYDDAMKRAKEALKVGTLKGILWHQGESDSNPKDAPVYEEKLHELISRMRKELNAEKIPFIAGQMGQFETRPWNDAKKQVDAAHQALPKKVPLTGFANSDDLGHKGDHIHFSSEAFRELGRRYAEEFRKVSKQSTSK